ncbi:tetratricopeptide repeat protein [Nocardia sp. NPDC004722]
MVRRAVTVGTWTRRQAVWATIVAIGVATAGLAVPTGQKWLSLVGASAVAVGAVVSVWLALKRAEAERDSEETAQRLRLQIPVTKVGEVAPSKIGVDPATARALARMPAYVARRIDAKVTAAIGDAVTGTGPWLVVVEGPSKVGKSRTLFQALQNSPELREMPLIAPMNQDKNAVNGLIDPVPPVPVDRPAVLWLDDLEPFLVNAGLTVQILQQWHGGVRGRIVVATHGGKGRDLFGDSKSLSTLASGVLAHAHRIPLQQTSDTEVEVLRNTLSANEFELVRRFGLAAYLVSGPELAGRLNAEADRCPEGTAVARAVIDWARCGRSDPVEETILRQMWPLYLPSRILPDDAGFTRGLEWAMAPVTGTIALVYRARGYLAFDLVVRFTSENSDAAPPPEVWAAAIDSATDLQAEAIGEAAAGYSRLTEAEAAFARAEQSASRPIAARATVNRGHVFVMMGHTDQALEIYDRLLAGYAADSDPDVRVHLAKALVERGDVLRFGRPQEALESYAKVVSDHAADPRARPHVATALLGTGVALERLDRLPDALAAYRQLVTYGDAQRWHLALAQAYLGSVLLRLDRPQEALQECEQVVTDHAANREPLIRAAVTIALVHQGLALEKVDRRDDALAAYRRVVADYATDTHPTARYYVVRALQNQASVLGGVDRLPEALEVHEQLVVGFTSDPDRRNQVAWAAFNRGDVLERMGRLPEALQAYEQVAADYGTDPGLRHQVAWALYGRGSVLGKLGRWQHALDAYQHVAETYTGDTDRGLRECAVLALAKRASIFSRLGHRQEALDTHQQVETESRATFPGYVASAIIAQGDTLDLMGRLPEALQAYERVAADAALGCAPEATRSVAEALLRRGEVLSRLGRKQEAFESYAQFVSDYATNSDPDFREGVIHALGCQAELLDELDRGPEAIPAFEQLVTDYGDNPDLTAWAAKARVQQGIALNKLGRQHEALKLFGRVIADHASASDSNLRVYVARARLNRGHVLHELGRHLKAGHAYLRLTVEFYADPDPELRRCVAEAWLRHGWVLAQRFGRHQLEAVGCYSWVVKRYADDPDLRGSVADALVMEGNVLADLGRLTAAMRNAERVLTDYADAPEFRYQLAGAMCLKGDVLAWSDHPQEAQQCYERVVTEYATEPNIRPVVIDALTGHSDLLTALGRPQDARAVLERVLIERAADRALCEEVTSILNTLPPGQNPAS